IVLRRKAGLDQMGVRVEVTGAMLKDRISDMEAMQRRFAKSIEQITGLRADVELVQPGAIPRSEGKARRIIDKRNEENA
ncbi:MAG TPA: phenylacetate--CoA ligase, partial [Fibrobacteraceae bacterium]|nr:phenylacetate--CoA ligase [Fibrobacteraceae bacterium]